MKEIAKEIEGIWTSDKSLARKRQDTEALLQCALADPAADLAALREALQAVVETCEAGVVERHETGKPTWKALDYMKGIARAALARSGKGEQ